MALHLLPSESLRTACRQRLEACELWLRRLVHDQLIKEFGPQYIDSAQLHGQHIFSGDSRKRWASRVGVEPSRYSRPVDALLLDDLAALVGKEDVYRKLFFDAFKDGFPIGREHVRLYLSRLVPIRNALAHANPLSTHDAERMLCYSNEIISAISAHYEKIGMEQDFNAPSFTRFSDSLGNVSQPKEARTHLAFRSGKMLRSGMNLRCEVEVDSSFDPSEYSVRWQIHGSGVEIVYGNSIALTLDDRHVNEVFLLVVQVASNKSWHRLSNFDAELNIQYRVLPQI